MWTVSKWWTLTTMAQFQSIRQRECRACAFTRVHVLEYLWSLTGVVMTTSDATSTGQPALAERWFLGCLFLQRILPTSGVFGYAVC